MQKTMQVHHVLLLQKCNAKYTANRCKKQCIDGKTETHWAREASASCLNFALKWPRCKIQCKNMQNTMKKMQKIHCRMQCKKVQRQTTARQSHGACCCAQGTNFCQRIRLSCCQLQRSIVRLGICQKTYTTQFSGARILHTENAWIETNFASNKQRKCIIISDLALFCLELSSTCKFCV